MINGTYTEQHLRDWYSREFPIDHSEAFEAARDYLNSLDSDEQDRVCEKGWPAMAVSLNHYQLYR